MLNLLLKINRIFLISFCSIWFLFVGMIQAGETPSVDGTRVYFINLEEISGVENWAARNLQKLQKFSKRRCPQRKYLPTVNPTRAPN